MTSYNFQKEVEVHVVYSGNKHKLDISSISFSQTFAQDSFEVKTLHNQRNLFAGSVINKANPANFEFTFPALKDGDFTTIFNLLVDYQGTTNKLRTFDLYISTKLDVFKVETAVITNGSFVIEKSRPLSLTVSGEASKLSHFGAVGSVTIPGNAVSRTANLRYIMNPAVTVTLNSSSIPNVVNATLELQNNIEWNPYTTVHGALATTTAANSMYPTDFTLQDRVLAGTIGKYITETKSSGNLALQFWDTSAPIVFTVGEGSGAAFRGFKVDGNCTYTNRVRSDAVFLENYEWRLIDNPSALGSILTYTTGA